MRTSNYYDLLPLIEHIKQGNLASVKEWIAVNKPIDLELHSEQGVAKRTPLQFAVEKGNYTIAEALLNAGAPVNLSWRYSGIKSALLRRRLDLVQMLVDRGYDVKSVPMGEVFSKRDPDIARFLIDRGADIRTGQPVARALIEKVHSVIKIFKDYRDRIPGLQEQGDMALRHHCCEGNPKWASLLLWAGADPYTRGESDPDAKPYPGEKLQTAIGCAIMCSNEDILKLGKAKIPREGPAFEDLLEFGYTGKAFSILKALLDDGVNPNISANGGCPLVQKLLEQLQHARSFNNSYNIGRVEPNADTEVAREYMKSLHILAMKGAKWRPLDKLEIASVRRSLLRMKVDYTLEFVWIASKYNAATHDDVHALLNTDAMYRLTFKVRTRLNQLLEQWPHISYSSVVQ